MKTKFVQNTETERSAGATNSHHRREKGRGCCYGTGRTKLGETELKSEPEVKTGSTCFIVRMGRREEGDDRQGKTVMADGSLPFIPLSVMH